MLDQNPFLEADDESPPTPTMRRRSGWLPTARADSG